MHALKNIFSEHTPAPRKSLVLWSSTTEESNISGPKSLQSKNNNSKNVKMYHILKKRKNKSKIQFGCLVELF
jgi:hypothetical protein